MYLAARNEHIQNKILKAKRTKKILICDRFIDSTIAYQVYGKKVEFKLIENIHKYILKKIKPDITFLLKVKSSKASSRLKKRKTKNRYDKFSKNFYQNAQKAFIKLAKKNKKRYFIFDNSTDDNELEKNEEEILRLFKIIEDINVENEQKDLVKLKKALFLIKISKDKEGKKLLNEIISESSVWKDTAAEILK